MGRNKHASPQLKSSSSSSQEVVLNNEDLLTLILFRVPWKTRMSLKCVSKQWLSLITARLSLLPPLRTSGLFFQYSEGLYFIHLDDPNTPSPFNPKRVSIVQSCNGLFLCHTDHDGFVSYLKRNYYVCNPCTNQVHTLPKHPCHNRVGVVPSIALAYDPSKSLHYKVICFLKRTRSSPGNRDVGDFYIYSSETRTWRVSIQSYYPARGMWFRGGVYCNGGMHWLSEYSESRPVSDCVYFNVDEERLETFPGPPMSLWSSFNSYFGESEDHLHYVEVCAYDASFTVYEMKSDYSGWFVKYQIDLVPISKVFPIMKKGSFYIGHDSFNAAVASLIRRENFKEDSFLVMELPGRIIHYNLVDRSFKVIWNFVGALKVKHSLRHWCCGSIKCWPYKPMS